MGRLIRGFGWSLICILALLILALGVANTSSALRLMENQVTQLTDGEVTITGLSGRFPDALRAGRIELRDRSGLWLIIENLRLDWAPSRLLVGTARVERLAVRSIALQRLPETTASEQEREESVWSLPFQIVVDSLRVDRFDLAEPVVGTASSLSLKGHAHIESLMEGALRLSVRGIDREDRYVLDAQSGEAGLRAHLTVQEADQGLLARLAGLPAEVNRLDLNAEAQGPLADLRSRFTLNVGPAEIAAQGTFDLEQRTGDVRVVAKAPDLVLGPGLIWKSVHLNAGLKGPLERPSVDADMRITGLKAAETRFEEIAATVKGNAGNLDFSAELDRIELPGPRPGLLGRAPLGIDANLRLDEVDRPFHIAVRHPLITVEGKGTIGAEPSGRFNLKLPDLEPIAALVDLDLRGTSDLGLHAASDGETLALDLTGKVAVTGGEGPFPGLIGDRAKLDLSLRMRETETMLSALRFEGKTLHLNAEGRIPGLDADLGFDVALSDLAVFAPRFSGQLEIKGRVRGRPDDLAVSADLNGDFAAENWPRGPVAAEVRIRGLPNAPSGTVNARGVLDRAPLNLAAKIDSGRKNAVRLAIDRADWKSAHVQGTLLFPEDTLVPIGRLDLRMTRLTDLDPLLRREVKGSLRANLEMRERSARFQLDAEDSGFPDQASVKLARLDLTITDLPAHPVVDGRLMLQGLRAGSTRGSANLEVKGPDHALALRLTSELKNLEDSDASLNTEALFDIPARRVTLSKLDAAWKAQILKLRGPVRIDYREGLAIDRMRLGLGAKGEIDLAGRVSPDLDLKLSLREIPADLANLFVPGMDVQGRIQANARLRGSVDRPTGSMVLNASGIGLRSGPGRALPHAEMDAAADLDGTQALVTVRLRVGTATLDLSGNAPFDPQGPLRLRAQGNLDLAFLDPVLAAGGRRVRGQLNLDARAEGTLADPRVLGSVDLSDGELLDYGQGIHLREMVALLRFDGNGLVLDRFEALAGPGTIRAQGSVGILSEEIPIDLRITARKARPLRGERLMVDLNADLRFTGRAATRMLAAGDIHINRAEIRIPDRTPARIALLKVRRVGEQPPPPPRPGPEIRLDLTIDAPEAVFVRGRGVDAELDGQIHIGGTLANLRPLGEFKMRRGEFNLAAQTLKFSTGEVGFHGNSLSDPSLRFRAETFGGGVTAILTVEGTANKPKITLSSDPSLPQDEILAQLLFGHSTSDLSALEWVQIASAVGTITGVTSDSANPLETVREGLGLDRLSFSSDSSGSPTLEAGSYVAPGVYVGTKQGISGTGTQATVQIDVTKNLKLESSVGTGAPSGSSGSNTGTSSVGIIYEYAY